MIRVPSQVLAMIGSRQAVLRTSLMASSFMIRRLLRGIHLGQRASSQAGHGALGEPSRVLVIDNRRGATLVDAFGGHDALYLRAQAWCQHGDVAVADGSQIPACALHPEGFKAWPALFSAVFHIRAIAHTKSH